MAETTFIRSYAGVRKPISPAQLATLAFVEQGLVFWKPSWGRVYGCRNDTFEVLERNELVAIAAEPENPGEREISHRHSVSLTDTGRAALERSRSNA